MDASPSLTLKGFGSACTSPGNVTSKEAALRFATVLLLHTHSAPCPPVRCDGAAQPSITVAQVPPTPPPPRRRCSRVLCVRRVQVTRTQLEEWRKQPFFKDNCLSGCVVRMAYGESVVDPLSGTKQQGYMVMEVGGGLCAAGLLAGSCWSTLRRRARANLCLLQWGCPDAACSAVRMHACMQIIEIRENQKKYKFGGSETNMWLYVADGLRIKRVMSMAVVSTKDITTVREAGRA